MGRGTASDAPQQSDLAADAGSSEMQASTGNVRDGRHETPHDHHPQPSLEHVHNQPLSSQASQAQAASSAQTLTEYTMAAGSSNKSGTNQEGSWKEDKPRKRKKEEISTMPQLKATNLTEVGPGRRLGRRLSSTQSSLGSSAGTQSARRGGGRGRGYPGCQTNSAG